MQMDERERVEQELRRLCTSGEVGRAAELALLGYGPEISRFIGSVLHDPALAQDAFGAFCESLVTGLPGFRWESSFRTWAYRLAHNACHQIRHSAAAREQPASRVAPADEAQRERTGTRPWLQTEVKERFRALRERLDFEERALLILRVDRKLPWAEVAQVMAGSEEPLGTRELQRRSAALRQQFQRIKARLHALALEEGLIPGAEEASEEERHAPPHAGLDR